MYRTLFFIHVLHLTIILNVAFSESTNGLNEDFDEDFVEELERVKALDDEGNLDIEKVLIEANVSESERPKTKKCLQDIPKSLKKKEMVGYILSCTLSAVL
ncbi:uncharacterized protein LOC123319869 [Coccinella septempunctata]|uniref:uncharacterized protein LOC123319869 n=1 Tax=Coccinella septempunctata TaxID=41139 RepID=UPI001D07ABFD|nr:uncharacterized protein LOC123319869 [Coccinella septempunctata]